jgi:hypothetical protein
LDPGKNRPRRGTRGYALVAFVAIVVVALLLWYTAGRRQRPAELNPAVVTTASASTTVKTTGTATSTSKTTVSGVGASSSTTKSEGGTGATSSTTVGQTDSTKGGQVKVVLKVNTGSCWLVVRQDSDKGAELYAGTLSGGGQQMFNNSKQYWVTVGEPSVLTVYINDKPHSLTGDPGTFSVTETGIQRVAE